MKKIALFSLFALLLLSACKKDKDEPAVSLLGKWTIENAVVKEYVNGVLTDNYTEPGDGSTFDFQDNGHLVITSPGNSVESVNYSIKPDSKVEIDGEIYEIRNLTASAVTLYIREDYSPGEYDEISINLKR